MSKVFKLKCRTNCREFISAKSRKEQGAGCSEEESGDSGDDGSSVGRGRHSSVDNLRRLRERELLGVWEHGGDIVDGDDAWGVEARVSIRLLAPRGEVHLAGPVVVGTVIHHCARRVIKILDIVRVGLVDLARRYCVVVDATIFRAVG